MRINNISQNNFNYNKVNNVSFGKYADENAWQKVHGEIEKISNPDMRSMCDFFAKQMDVDENFVYYTDKETGKIKGKFDEEFVKNNSDPSIYMQRAITISIELLTSRGNLNDLSVPKNIRCVGRVLRDIQKLLQGINLADERRKCLRGNDESENYAAMRAEEETYR